MYIADKNFMSCSQMPFSQYSMYFAALSPKIDLKNSANILFRNYRDFLIEIAM